MTLPEIKEWSTNRFPKTGSLNPIVNRGSDRIVQTIQAPLIIPPVPLKPLPHGSKRLIEGEQPSGPRSDEKKYPPIKVSKLDFKTAYTAFYFGQGQSYEVHFRSIRFKNGTFHQDSDFMKEVNKLAKEAEKQGTIITKDINLEKQDFEFEDESKDEAWVYGSIKVNVKGELLVDAKGKWEFDGTFSPGLKQDDTTGEIYRGDRLNLVIIPLQQVMVLLN